MLGPFAHLRPASDVSEGAHVGNFVELKKTTLGAGSKANHLAYLGDATIGDGVNVGAGTITCNYDGTKKHQTVIEDGAFIGSDSHAGRPRHDRRGRLRRGRIDDHRGRSGRRARHRAGPAGEQGGLGEQEVGRNSVRNAAETEARPERHRRLA